MDTDKSEEDRFDPSAAVLKMDGHDRWPASG